MILQYNVSIFYCDSHCCAQALHISAEQQMCDSLQKSGRRTWRAARSSRNASSCRDAFSTMLSSRSVTLIGLLGCDPIALTTTTCGETRRAQTGALHVRHWRRDLEGTHHVDRTIHCRPQRWSSKSFQPDCDKGLNKEQGLFPEADIRGWNVTLPASTSPRDSSYTSYYLAASI